MTVSTLTQQQLDQLLSNETDHYTSSCYSTTSSEWDSGTSDCSSEDSFEVECDLPGRRMQLSRWASEKLLAIEHSTNADDGEDDLFRLFQQSTPIGLNLNEDAEIVLQTSMPSQSLLNYDDKAQDPTSQFSDILAKLGALKVKNREYESLDDFFVDITSDRVKGYDLQIVKAIRDNDFVELAMLCELGKKMDSCNKFGESIIHLAARRGSTRCLDFLIRQGVDIRVCCDSGRNPLHDACWTSSPNFDTVLLLLQEWPDFLLIQDKKGYTPFQYIPRDSWSEWNEFLDQHTDILRPKVLL